MKLDELDISTELKNQIKNSIDYAKEMISQSEMMMPTLLLSNQQENKKVIVKTDFKNYRQKQLFAEKARELAIKHNADLSIFICESYFLSNDDVVQYKNNEAKYDYSMANHPNHKNGLFITIETFTSTIIARGEITKERELLEMDFMKDFKIEGIFANILKKKVVN